MTLEKLKRKIKKEHICIANELVEIINKNESDICYGELSKLILDKFGIRIDLFRSMPHRLELLSRISNELQLPMISAIVINKQKKIPGAGFFKLYDNLHNTEYKGDKKLEEKIAVEMNKKVRSCKEWNKLLTFLNN